jgi:hypothetical protein
VAAGVTDDCGDCLANWNRTYTLTFSVNNINGCCWHVVFPNQCILKSGFGTSNADSVALFMQGASEIFVAVLNTAGGAFTCFDGSGIWNFAKSYASGAIPCATLSAEDIPLTSGGTAGCDFTAATCEVTAI